MAQDDADAPMDTADWARLARPSLTAFAHRVALRALEPVAHGMARAGSMPDRLRFVPADPRRGDKHAGQAILACRFRFGGAELETAGAQPWGLRIPNARFRQSLQRFDWLADLGALCTQNDEEGAEAGRMARRLTDGWIEGHSAFDTEAWRPDVVGRRLLAWLSAAPILTAGSDTIWKSRLYHSLAVQTRYLAQISEHAPAGPARSVSLTAAVVAMLTLGDTHPRLQRLQSRLVPAYRDQILPDGGHISRSPTALLHLVCDLVLLRDALGEVGQSLPKELQDTLDAARPLLRFFHLGGGRLAAFHGGGADRPELVEDVLGLEPAVARPFAHAPHSAYHRLDAGGTTLIVDVGGPPPLEAADRAHASCTAFEMCSNGQPVVINCGPAHGSDPIEDRIARATAAHSTLSLGPGSSAHVLNGSFAGRVLGPRLVGGPASPIAQRHDESSAGYGGIWLDVAHEGYGRALSARHVRRIYLQERGLDLRGEDRIEPITEGARLPPTPFVLRFHIDPAVVITPSNGEPGARLRLPNGELWRFECRGGDVRVEDSRRYGPDGPEPAQQITVRGQCETEAHILKWAFRREAGPADLPPDDD